MGTVIVSNRLPVVLEATEDGARAHPGSGGLVTALSSTLRRTGGKWIGWPGTLEADPTQMSRILCASGRAASFDVIPIALEPALRKGFYEGFSNEIVWPLFHDQQSRCNFAPEYWTSYQQALDRFAAVVADATGADDFIWVHDYHLMGLGRKLRELGVKSRLGFFLHIPFPPPDIFAKLPWRVEILQSLLAYQVVGFQTPHDLESFVACVRRYLPDAKRRHRQRRLVVSHEREFTVCGAFPIGIDSAEFEEAANSKAVAERVAKLRADVQGQQIVLGVDRLDYTKGIPHRLRALQLALKRHPELHRKMTMLQLVVPSRENVHEYQELRAQIEQLVSQINGEFAQPGWTPIQYLFRNLEREELVSWYRAADVALVTPLKDGMNLVAKEYCACQIDGNGVLILSEFAGAADQLDVGAILVNPFDFERVAESIKRAVLLPPGHRRPAMRRLRRNVRNFDVHWWVGRFFAAAGFADSLGHPPQRDLGRVIVA